MKVTKNDYFLSLKYDIFEEIGKGAHGTVFRGFDKINKKLVAIKKIETLKNL